MGLLEQGLVVCAHDGLPGMLQALTPCSAIAAGSLQGPNQFLSPPQQCPSLYDTAWLHHHNRTCGCKHTCRETEAYF